MLNKIQKLIIDMARDRLPEIYITLPNFTSYIN
jgi:hypothetical protein